MSMTRDLRATRDRLGLSTRDLATLVGVAERTVQKWLAGREVPEPVWRLLDMWNTAKPETIRAVLQNGYGIEVGKVSDLTDEQKRMRMSPEVRLFYLPPDTETTS